MTATRANDLWSRVDFALVPPVPVTTGTLPSVDDGSFDRARQHWRRRRPLLDAVGTFVWVYAVVKVFIADFDVVERERCGVAVFRASLATRPTRPSCALSTVRCTASRLRPSVA